MQNLTRGHWGENTGVTHWLSALTARSGAGMCEQVKSLLHKHIAQKVFKRC